MQNYIRMKGFHLQEWLGRQIQTAIGSPAGIVARRWLGLRGASRANHEIHGVPVPAEIVVYFGDVATKLYQIEQWLPVLERLHAKHRILLVFRKVSALRALKKRTSLPMLFARRFEDLMALYDNNDYTLGIYVNNGVTNFQSLSFARMIHVHVNHGESDKLSMVSNQAKAYDRIFIAGPAAVDRHRSVLLEFDESKLMKVGRPQLDLDFTDELPSVNIQTVMYAPTWEGENASNNYTSLDMYGRQIIEALLALPQTRVVYKPHPRVASSSDPEILEAHEAVVQAIEEANVGRGNQHVVSTEGNILAMFNSVDGLITDVSSVGLDFLYLHPERPLILTDRRTDKSGLAHDAPVSSACSIIDENTIVDVRQLVASALEEDAHVQQRAEMRRYYFGDFAKGDSTKAFVSAISELISAWNQKLEGREFHASSLEAADE